MSDGHMVPIRDISVGDELLGRNGINRVVAIRKPKLDCRLVGINGMEAMVSETHPMLTTDGWGCFNVPLMKLRNPTLYSDMLYENEGKPLVDIGVGSKLVTMFPDTHGVILVESVDYVDTPGMDVFMMTVSGDHTYVAENVVSHNKV